MKNSDWVQDKEDRVKKLENAITLLKNGVFIGTMEEYQIVLQNNNVKNGTIVALSTLS